MARQKLRKRGLAAQPTASAGVVLATTYENFSPDAIRLAAEVAGDNGVAVVVITRIHGYALGIPNPGLLPTRREQDMAKKAVTEAVSALHQHGVAADGQVAATRTATKTISRIARVRSAQHIVMDKSDQGSRLRRLIEGDPTAGLRRRLDPSIEIHVVSR